VPSFVATLVFAALAFGWRSLVHYRQTGSSGFRGFSGAPGSLEWFGGVLFAVTCAVVLAASVCDLTGSLPRLASLDTFGARAAGATLWAVGVVGTLWAQFAMGTSWRIGVDRSEHTALATDGTTLLTDKSWVSQVKVGVNYKFTPGALVAKY